MTAFLGTTGNDRYPGSELNDQYEMSQGGRDTVSGRQGNDQFYFGAEFTARDSIRGGTDSGNPFIGRRDALSLDGDYSAGVIFGAKTMTGVETLFLGAGHDYAFTIHDATVAAADFLTVKADRVGIGHTVFFDASADTDGTLRYYGSEAWEHVTGGAGGDSFRFLNTGFWAADRIDGGSGGFDELILDGDYSAGTLFGIETIRNIDVIYMYGGHDYTLASDDGNVAAGETLTVSGAFLEAGDILKFDGSRELDGTFNLYGGDDNDVLVGGRRSDLIQGNGGRDVMAGGNGNDILAYAGESGGLNEYDTAVRFDFDHGDKFDMWFKVRGIDPALSSGSLSEATFDADLSAALAGHFFVRHAVLFTPDSGDFAGNTFLVIDADATDGYTGGVDVAILLQNPVNLEELTLTDFI